MTENLKLKINLAENEIRAAYVKNDGNLFVSFSGGKDSTVLVHIARSIYPDIKIVFSNTTNELREVIEFVKKQKNIEWVKPTISFVESLKVHGFPLVSKEVAHFTYQLKNSTGVRTKNLRLYGNPIGLNGISGKVGKLSKKWLWLAEQDFDLNNKCCQRLKKDPLEKWAKKNNMRPIIGIMAGESRSRQQLALFGNDSKGQVYPFLRTGWEESDIWAYAKEFNVRFAECYYDRKINGVLLKGEHRTGCEYCGFGIHLEENDRFIRSRLLTPKRYNKIMDIENNGVKFSSALNMVKNVSEQKVNLGLYGYNIVNVSEDDTKIIFKLKAIHNKPNKKCNCGGLVDIKPRHNTITIKDIPREGKETVLSIEYYKGLCSKCNNVLLPTFPFINIDKKKTDRLLHKRLL